MSTNRKTGAEMPPGQASRAALADAEIGLANARQALASADVTLVDLERRMRAGDETLTSLELVTARVEVERHEAMVQVGERKVTLAQRNLRVDIEDAHLAAAVAEHCAAILGVPADAAIEAPGEAGDSLPYLAIVQSKPGEHDPSTGAFAGEVTLWFVRTEMHRELDAERLVNALTDAGVRIDYSRATSELRTGQVAIAGGVADTLALTVLEVTPLDSLPTITAEVRSGMDAVLKGIGSTISREVHRRGTRVDPARFGYSEPVRLVEDRRQSGTLYFGKAGGELASERPEPFGQVDTISVDGGVRTVIGRAGVNLSGDLYGVSELAAIAERIAQSDIVGRCHGPLGKVETVEAVGTQRVGQWAVFAEFRIIAKSLATADEQ